MSNTHKPVWFRFSDRTEVYQSHAWRLEIDAATQKALLGLPYWTEVEILSHYEPDPHPEQDLTAAALSPNDSDPNLTTLVPKNARKSKSKQTSPKLPDVSELLDKFVPPDNLPESESTGSDDSISDSLD